MSLPAFNEYGDLPAGVHLATLANVLERFGQGSPQRALVAHRLQRLHRLATDTSHVARFIVYGSFVTTKASPNDVDIFLLMDDDFDLSQVQGESKIVFDHMACQDYEGASIFWIRRLAAFEGEEAAVAHWQDKRDGTQRGIVEVIG
jgi:hypothetical protein